MRPNLTSLIEVCGSPLIQIEGQNDFGGSCDCLSYKLCNVYASLNLSDNRVEIVGEIGKVPDEDVDLKLVAVAYDSAGEAIDTSHESIYFKNNTWGGVLFSMFVKYPETGLSKISISANLLEARWDFEYPEPTTGPD
jgi:hypothetical protein